MLALAQLLSPMALMRYDDHGDPAYTARERLLIAMRRMDWATSSEIFDATPGEMSGPRHVNEHQALHRLVVAGVVRSRGDYGCREYKLVLAAFCVLAETRQCCRTRCPRMAVAGRAQCQHHLDYAREWERSRRKRAT